MSDVQESAPAADQEQVVESDSRDEAKPAEIEASPTAQSVSDKPTPAGTSLTSLPAVGSLRSSATTAAQKEVSVATVVRLMGLPTAAELRIVEQKIDTLTTRIGAMSQKLDRIAGAVQSTSDVDGVQVQIADVKRLIKELMTKFEK